MWEKKMILSTLFTISLMHVLQIHNHKRCECNLLFYVLQIANRIIMSECQTIEWLNDQMIHWSNSIHLQTYKGTMHNFQICKLCSVSAHIHHTRRLHCSRSIVRLDFKFIAHIHNLILPIVLYTSSDGTTWK